MDTYMLVKVRISDDPHPDGADQVRGDLEVALATWIEDNWGRPTDEFGGHNPVLSAEVKGGGPLSLDYFETLQSEASDKFDLELTCTKCDTVLCDVENADDMEVLLSVVMSHRCGVEQ